MKNSIKFLSIALTIAAMSFTSCNKDDDHYVGPPTPIEKETDCCTELTFMDPGMCGGAWFKTSLGENIEVYGYPNVSKLRKGDKVQFGYREFDNDNLIQCTGMTQYEVMLYEQCSNYRSVKAKRECFDDDKEEPTGCDNELECVDLGICGGVWFKDKHSNYFEVYDYPEKDKLRVGDIVKFGYTDYTHSGNVCLAMTQWEMRFFESKEPYKVVKAKRECFDDDKEEPTGCDTKVTYYKKDFCSGDLLKTEDGKLLRAFGLNVTDRVYKEGDQFRISYQHKVLQYDCTYVRQPDEMGEPVDITCQTGASPKE